MNMRRITIILLCLIKGISTALFGLVGPLSADFARRGCCRLCMPEQTGIRLFPIQEPLRPVARNGIKQ
jgi:hypothetical protein